METKEPVKATDKATRTPRNFDSILKGAKSLSLKEKVDLRNALSTDITKEVESADIAAKQAKEIAGIS